MTEMHGVETHRRGSPTYESARQDAVWNGRVPDRYPDIIVRPVSNDQVVSCVRYAIAHDLKIGVRSGGHSWSASFLRDGGMLIDLSRMTKMSLNVDTGIAYAEPGAHGGDLNAMLAAHKLMFPAGHCPSVGLGGFLLQGGFGWNSRKWGVGAHNVVGIDVVTADGNLVHADETQHRDLLWAARGAGPGFFGVVTRFDLATHPLPLGMMTSSYLYPIDTLDELLLWLDEVQPAFPPDLEVSMFIVRDQFGVDGASVQLVGDALCESSAQAHRALSILDASPVLDRAITSSTMKSVGLDGLLQRFEDLLDARGRRYEVDNTWTSAPVSEVLPAIHDIVENLPPNPSHLYLLWWGPQRTLDEMSFSLEGRLWLSFYAITTDSTADAAHQSLVTAKMRNFEPWADGIQLADENLAGRPFRFMADANFHKLQNLRAAFDSHGRFHSYLAVPAHLQAPATSVTA